MSNDLDTDRIVDLVLVPPAAAVDRDTLIRVAAMQAAIVTTTLYALRDYPRQDPAEVARDYETRIRAFLAAAPPPPHDPDVYTIMGDPRLHRYSDHPSVIGSPASGDAGGSPRPDAPDAAARAT